MSIKARSALLCGLLAFARGSQARAEISTLERAAEAEKEGKLPEAASQLEIWTATHPDDLDSLNRLAKLYAWTKRYEAAEKIYLSVLKKKSDSEDALVGLGYVNAWMKHYAEAKRYFNRVLKKNSRNLDALKGLAKVQFWSGRPHRARILFQRVLRMDSKDADALEFLQRPRLAVPRIEAGSLLERYSRAGNGDSWWMNSGIPLGRAWSALAGAERVHRFGQNDVSGSLGAAWKGEGKGGYFQARQSPNASVIPRWGVGGAWDQSLARGLYVEGSLQVSEYQPAHVYAESLGIYWWPWTRAEIFTQAGATTTRFRAAGTVTKERFLGLVNFYPWGESVRITPSLSYYEEPFEAGAPGGTRSFAAFVYRLGAGLRFLEDWEARLDLEYERRNDQTFVRRAQAALSYQF